MGTRKPPDERSEEHFEAAEETKGVIPFEDAWQRELEFRKRIRMRSFSVASRLLHAAARELPSKTNIDENKMNEVFPSKEASSLPSHSDRGEFRNRSMPLQPQQVSTEKLQSHQPSPQHLRSYQPLLQKRPLLPMPEEQYQRSGKKPMAELPEERETSAEETRVLERYSMKQALTDQMQSSSSQTIPIPLRCNICNVSCTGKVTIRPALSREEAHGKMGGLWERERDPDEKAH